MAGVAEEQSVGGVGGRSLARGFSHPALLRSPSPAQLTALGRTAVPFSSVIQTVPVFLSSTKTLYLGRVDHQDSGEVVTFAKAYTAQPD